MTISLTINECSPYYAPTPVQLHSRELSDSLHCLQLVLFQLIESNCFTSTESGATSGRLPSDRKPITVEDMKWRPYLKSTGFDRDSRLLAASFIVATSSIEPSKFKNRGRTTNLFLPCLQQPLTNISIGSFSPPLLLPIIFSPGTAQ
jgi:hypothetical protein